MAQIIAVTNDARQTFTTVLNGQKVRLNAFFLVDNPQNGIVAGWYVDLFLIGATTDPVVQGTRLTSYISILDHLVTSFNGGIVPIPLTSPPTDLNSREPWGTTHLLVYFTNEELAGVE